MAMDKSTVSSTTVEFEIVHAVRDRIRLRLKGDYAREILPHITRQLRQQAGIITVQIKQASNSIIIGFDPDVISLDKLVNSLQALGFSSLSAEGTEELTEKSLGSSYERVLSLVPPLVGIVIARGLQVSGWKSILTYILAAGVTREVIDQVTGESEESEKVELASAKKVSTTEVVTEEVASLLIAIETDYEIVHQIPGRIRLRVPIISRDFNYAQKLKHRLEQDNRIIQVRCKINTGSVVILYNPDIFSDSNKDQLAVDDNKGQEATQITDASDNSAIRDSPKVAIKSDVNETPSADAESASEPISLTPKTATETNETLKAEEESTTPIVPEASEIDTEQKFLQQAKIISSDYWSNFKSSMLLGMLKLIGNLQAQTAKN